MIASHRVPTFRSDPARLDVRYLAQYFRTAPGVDLLGRVSPGGAGRNRTLNRSTFLEQAIPIPGLAEQRRIVAKLERLSKSVDEARTLRELASRGSRLLHKQAAAAVVDAVAEASTLEPLGTLVTVRGGGTPSKANPVYWEGSVPWITPKDMKRRALTDAMDHISANAADETAAKLLDPGCVLVVVRGMILAHTVPSAVLRAPASINQDMKALIPSPRLLPEYLCGVLWAWNARLLRLVEKSTHDTRKLETDKLLGFRLPVLPIAGQQQVLGRLEALEITASQAADSQVIVERELEALMPAILYRTFKGEL